MKHFLPLLFIFILVSSCNKDRHTIRVRNWLGESVQNIYIGKTFIKTASSVGAYTDYYPIKPGKFEISGTTPSGKILKGTGKIRGFGNCKWTMYISTNGDLYISQD